MVANLRDFLGQSAPFFLCLFGEVRYLGTESPILEKYLCSDDVCDG